ncbi:MAG: substrate-binding domain-containing protein [Bacteroidetes bacterium]|nr:substrate-binding domain-containing protein [Bacteroidota bacterium]
MKEPTDTATSGDVNIVIDESYTLLFDTEIHTFQSLYVNAKVHARYLPEDDAIIALMNDSAKVAVINRPLKEEEKKNFGAKNIFPIETKIAEDAIAFVVNTENPDTNIKFEEIARIMAGIDTTWKQVNEKSTTGGIRIIFDNPNSANARYIANFSKQAQLPKNAYAVKSNAEVIEYVNNNKNAIGVVSVNWISDKDDSTTIGFLKKIKVLGISKAGNTEKYYKPYQAYIKTKDYPFCRDVYMINRQTRAGLGMGFVSFVAGEKGQRIILKMGLVPSIAPTRMVEIH